MNVVACVLLPFSLPPFTACACSLFEATSDDGGLEVAILSV